MPNFFRKNKFKFLVATLTKFCEKFAKSCKEYPNFSWFWACFLKRVLQSYPGDRIVSNEYKIMNKKRGKTQMLNFPKVPGWFLRREKFFSIIIDKYNENRECLKSNKSFSNSMLLWVSNFNLKDLDFTKSSPYKAIK